MGIRQRADDTETFAIRGLAKEEAEKVFDRSIMPIGEQLSKLELMVNEGFREQKRDLLNWEFKLHEASNHKLNELMDAHEHKMHHPLSMAPHPKWGKIHIAIGGSSIAGLITAIVYVIIKLIG